MPTLPHLWPSDFLPMPRPHLLFVAPFAAALACLASPFARAEDAKDAKKTPPLVIANAPLAVTPGSKVTLRLRGLGIDAATDVRFPDAKTPPQAAIKSKGKVTVPQGFEAKGIGDAQVEVELTVPPDA